MAVETTLMPRTEAWIRETDRLSRLARVEKLPQLK